MEDYLVCEVTGVYGVFLHLARRFTDDEKKDYSDYFKERGFVGISEALIMEGLTESDVSSVLGDDRECDGSFLSCFNMAYIITDTEWIELMELNKQRLSEKAAKEKAVEIEVFEKTIRECEKQGKLYSDEEAKAKRAEYNRIFNEGGEGFVPHFYTHADYEYAKAKLAELTACGEEKEGEK